MIDDCLEFSSQIQAKEANYQFLAQQPQTAPSQFLPDHLPM